MIVYIFMFVTYVQYIWSVRCYGPHGVDIIVTTVAFLLYSGVLYLQPMYNWNREDNIKREDRGSC